MPDDVPLVPWPVTSSPKDFPANNPPRRELDAATEPSPRAPAAVPGALLHPQGTGDDPDSLMWRNCRPGAGARGGQTAPRLRGALAGRGRRRPAAPPLLPGPRLRTDPAGGRDELRRSRVRRTKGAPGQDAGRRGKARSALHAEQRRQRGKYRPKQAGDAYRPGSALPDAAGKRGRIMKTAVRTMPGTSVRNGLSWGATSTGRPGAGATPRSPALAAAPGLGKLPPTPHPSCGKPAGWWAHRRRGERQCLACREAINGPRRKGTPRGRPRRSECGSEGGYRRHLNEHTPVCEACREAVNAVNRARYAVQPCAACGYLRTARGHRVECGGES